MSADRVSVEERGAQLQVDLAEDYINVMGRNFPPFPLALNVEYPSGRVRLRTWETAEVLRRWLVAQRGASVTVTGRYSVSLSPTNTEGIVDLGAATHQSQLSQARSMVGEYRRSIERYSISLAAEETRLRVLESRAQLGAVKVASLQDIVDSRPEITGIWPVPGRIVDDKVQVHSIEMSFAVSFIPVVFRSGLRSRLTYFFSTPLILYPVSSGLLSPRQVLREQIHPHLAGATSACLGSAGTAYSHLAAGNSAGAMIDLISRLRLGWNRESELTSGWAETGRRLLTQYARGQQPSWWDSVWDGDSVQLAHNGEVVSLNDLLPDWKDILGGRSRSTVCGVNAGLSGRGALVAAEFFRVSEASGGGEGEEKGAFSYLKGEEGWERNEGDFYCWRCRGAGTPCECHGHVHCTGCGNITERCDCAPVDGTWERLRERLGDRLIPPAEGSTADSWWMLAVPHSTVLTVRCSTHPSVRNVLACPSNVGFMIEAITPPSNGRRLEPANSLYCFDALARYQSSVTDLVAGAKWSERFPVRLARESSQATASVEGGTIDEEIVAQEEGILAAQRENDTQEGGMFQPLRVSEDEDEDEDEPDDYPPDINDDDEEEEEEE